MAPTSKEVLKQIIVIFLYYYIVYITNISNIVKLTTISIIKHSIYSHLDSNN